MGCIALLKLLKLCTPRRRCTSITHIGRKQSTSWLPVSTMVLVTAAVIAALAPTTARASGGVESSGGEAGRTLYIDPQLGFGLLLPPSWTAESQPGVHNAGHMGVVLLHRPLRQSMRIEVAVMRGPQMSSAFKRYGTPNTRIGPFPAVVADLADADDADGAEDSQMESPGPAADAAGGLRICRVATFLSGDDYVMGQACGPQGATTDGSLEAVLATYSPRASMSPSSVAHTRALSGAATAQSDAARATAARPQSCAELVAGAADRPADATGWGRELASATDPRWGPYPSPAAAVCSNFYTRDGHVVAYDGYLFQCVELANRFLREQWGHGGVVGNGANWFDYTDATGARHPGTARVYPDMQLADDASQGISAFKPVPGDLLIWQDVLDGETWTSGLRRSTGHIAVIAGVDDTHVSFMQQNYSDWHYYMSLPLERVANGWHIRDDVSGVAGRIVRGWIHATENGGVAAPPSDAPLASVQDVYAVGTQGLLYNFHVDQGGSSWAPTQRASAIGDVNPRLVGPIVGSPSVPTCPSDSESQQEVFATGRDGKVYIYAPQVADGGQPIEVVDVLPAPRGVALASSPSALCYRQPGDTRATVVVFVLGSNGHLYRYERSGDGMWSDPFDLTAGINRAAPARLTPAQLTAARVSGGQVTGAPTAVAWIQGNQWQEAVYLTRSNGHLTELRSAADGSWHSADVSALAHSELPDGVSLTGTPSAYVVMPPGSSAPQSQVFAVGSDGHVYRYAWLATSTGGGWSTEDISQEATDDVAGDTASGVTYGITDPLRFIGSPSAHYLVESGTGTQVVFVTGNDGNLYEFSAAGGPSSSWRRTTVSARTNQSVLVWVTSSPVGYSYTLAGDPRVRHTVFALTADGHLVEFAYLQLATPEWVVTDRGAPVGRTLDGALAALAWVAG